ncbi:acetylxylan esterase [Paenibacillus solisilvae]|uniref:Acetylxylan esterase n=1 Tax=Paenibacillus solisilvae TaxID=2486751 RepID=A0ABW0W032_9BACL
MHAISRRKRDLEQYMPDLTIETELVEAYWDSVLQAYQDKPLQVKLEPSDSPFPSVTVQKLTYEGYDHTPIHGWYMVPAEKHSQGLPCIVTLPGYTGDKGYPERYAEWLLLGYAVLAVDVRGQGGETGNRLPEAAGSSKGWVSMGLADKEHSYYQAITIDAVRAVDVAAQLPEVDRHKIAVFGVSQGGGLALLAGALHSSVAAIIADIPNMCHMDYGVLHSTGSLTEIAQHLKRYPDQLEPVLETLAYFDMLNLAPRIHAPVLMSVGWKDTVCLPETIYAVYNRLNTDKRIYDYPFNGHEVGEFHNRERIQFLSSLFK